MANLNLFAASSVDVAAANDNEVDPDIPVQNPELDPAVRGPLDIYNLSPFWSNPESADLQISVKDIVGLTPNSARPEKVAAPIFTLEITGDLDHLFNTFTFQRSGAGSPDDQTVTTDGEGPTWLRILSALNTGRVDQMTYAMKLIVHGDRREGGREDSVEEIHDVRSWVTFWQYFISRCLNRHDNQGISVNSDALAGLLVQPQASELDNQILGKFVYALGTPYGSAVIKDKRPEVTDYYLAALSFYLLELRGTSVDGDRGSFEGDVSQQPQRLKLFEGDALHWWTRVQTQTQCNGCLCFRHQTSVPPKPPLPPVPTPTPAPDERFIAARASALRANQTMF